MLIYAVTNENDLNNIPQWAKWIELRIDLCSSLTNYLDQLRGYKLIITDRSYKEGGKSQRSLQEKVEYYKQLKLDYEIYFDLEIELLRQKPDIDLNYDFYFLSFHSFEALDISKLDNQISFAKKYQPYMIKFAQYCSSFKEVNQLYQLVKASNIKLLWLVMGPYGYLQRLLYPYLESQGSYIANSSQETVKGQLTVESVEKYQHFLKSDICKWGGLIGGQQVYSSIGLDFYNSYFKQHNLSAIYLPIYLSQSDISEFFDLLESNKKLRDKCYGFSLTMPFKKVIPQLFNKQKISNLLITTNSYSFYNTDYDALYKMKRKLKEKAISNVLIYGSGSMAELALDIFSDYKIFLTGRNKKRLQELKRLNNNIEIIDQITPELYFDLLINTSPIGMKGESFSQETGISKFKYVIDLPYSPLEIPLAKQIAKTKYFSGREFWQYQSERQLQLFKESIGNDKE